MYRESTSITKKQYSRCRVTARQLLAADDASFAGPVTPMYVPGYAARNLMVTARAVSEDNVALPL